MTNELQEIKMYARIATVLPLLLLALAPLQSLAQCEDWVQGPIDDGSLPTGSNGQIYASMRWDADGAGPLLERLVVGGDFSSIGGVPANNIAQFNPSTASWEAFGFGIAPAVFSLTVFNGQVVAGRDGDNDVGTFDATVRRMDRKNNHPFTPRSVVDRAILPASRAQPHAAVAHQRRSHSCSAPNQPWASNRTQNAPPGAGIHRRVTPPSLRSASVIPSQPSFPAPAV
jgi:hypothetical protein